MFIIIGAVLFPAIAYILGGLVALAILGAICDVICDGLASMFTPKKAPKPLCNKPIYYRK